MTIISLAWADDDDKIWEGRQENTRMNDKIRIYQKGVFKNDMILNKRCKVNQENLENKNYYIG